MGSDGGDVVLDPEPAVAGENKPFRHRVELEVHGRPGTLLPLPTSRETGDLNLPACGATDPPFGGKPSGPRRETEYPSGGDSDSPNDVAESPSNGGSSPDAGNEYPFDVNGRRADPPFDGGSRPRDGSAATPSDVEPGCAGDPDGAADLVADLYRRLPEARILGYAFVPRNPGPASSCASSPRGSLYAVSSGVSFRCRQGVSLECRLTQMPPQRAKARSGPSTRRGWR